MRLLLPLLVAGLAASLGAARAHAAPSNADVELRGVMQASGAKITLGDLFEGAGAAGSTVVGAAAPAGGQAVLDAGLVQAAARRAGLVWANGEGRRRLIVASAEADRPAPGRAAGGSRRHAQVLAYARNLNAGEMVSASDLVWSDEAVASPDAVADADAAIGKAARRPLRMGAAASAHDLGAPRVIKRDDMVQVAFEDAGVTLVLTGKALGDAAVGDSLPVLNPASRKTLDAVAAGPGRAVVGPAAEALRLRAFPSLQYASARE